MEKNKTRSFITILNLTLLLLLVFLGYQAVKKFLGVHMKQVSAESLTAKYAFSKTNQMLSSNSTLSDYKSVWERDLFNIPQKTFSLPGKQINFADVAEVDKDIGLRLVGTILFNYSAITFAIIEYNKDQNIYYEGETAGGYTIKKILRNKVIIATENEDKLLVLKSDRSGQGGIVYASTSQTPSESYRQDRSGGRFRTIELPREQIMAAIDDIELLIIEGKTSPYKLGKLTGFNIDSLLNKSILKKIGLRNHDKILAINDKPIEGGKGAFEFFEQIAEGKKVTIKYRRRNRTRRIELNPI